VLKPHSTAAGLPSLIMASLGLAVPNRLLEHGVSSSVSGTCSGRRSQMVPLCSSKSQRASGRSRGKAAPKSAATGGAAPAAAPSPLPAAPAPAAAFARPPPPPSKQIMAAPEDFQAPSGQLIPVNVMHPPSPADVFKCIGCVRPECQVGRRAAASGRQAGGGSVLCSCAALTVVLISGAQQQAADRVTACPLSGQSLPPAGMQHLPCFAEQDRQGSSALSRSLSPNHHPTHCLQGPTGCTSVDLAWRREPEGYLKEILTARWA
jgi:hypothetical protein